MPKKNHHTETHRTCYRCGEFKPNDRFTWRSNGTPFSACKDCNRVMAKERAAKKRAEKAAVEETPPQASRAAKREAAQTTAAAG